MTIDYITIGKNKYPIREIRLSEYEVDVKISNSSLEAEVFDGDGKYTSREAQLIDELVFFYVPDDLILSNDEEAIEQYITDNLDW